MDKEHIILNGIKWHVGSLNHEHITPLCPKHHLSLSTRINNSHFCLLKCEECVENYRVPRSLYAQKTYLLDKLNAKVFRNAKFINLDDEAIPIAESKASSKDNKYFVTALLTQSKVGQRLVVYAGEKGKKDKTQIFIEPEIKRLSFDQNDLHPSDVFVALEGTFTDGTTNSIHKKTNGK